jgi:hypothetical protein
VYKTVNPTSPLKNLISDHEYSLLRASLRQFYEPHKGELLTQFLQNEAIRLEAEAKQKRNGN